MARDVYYVERHGPHWQINHGDRQHGPYGSQGAAIMVAITAAHRAGQTNPGLIPLPVGWAFYLVVQMSAQVARMAPEWSPRPAA